MLANTIQPQRELFIIQPTIAAANTKIRVAGYARVSSGSDDQLNSFSAQVNYYTKLISENEQWQLVEVYADEAKSGVSTEKRSDFNRMINDCKKGKIDRIITKSTSRFSRNTLDTLTIIRELKAIGTSVYFEKENIDTSKLSGENLLTLYSTFAQQESISISQNCKKGARMRMQNGTYVPSSVPYGYRLVNNSLEIHETEAAIIRRIFNAYLDGQSLIQIAKQLKSDGIPCKNGCSNDWRYLTIAYIIRNERYKGDMLLQKRFNEDVLPYRNRINNGELPQYYIKNSHTAIITEVQYELANILLRERSSHINPVHKEYPLSQKLHCQKCGNSYRRKTSNNIIYWVCRNHDEGKENCPSNRIPEENIYQAFIRTYNKLRQNYKHILQPMLNQLEKIQEYNERGNPEINTINKQIAELSEQHHTMNELLQSGILDAAIFISSCDDINKKLRNLKQAKAGLLADNEQDNPLTQTEILISILENSADKLLEFDESIFSDMVEEIIAFSSQEIEFKLINGLILTERLV